MTNITATQAQATHMDNTPSAPSAHVNTHVEHPHTSPVLVFGILTIATIVEIAMTVLKLQKDILVPLLLGLSFSKASLVAAYYMHLRYERWIYTAVFIAPTLFAIFLVLILTSSI